MADTKSPSKKRALIFYHFFYPDDVVSAVLFSELAQSLAQRDYEVRSLTSNRYCRQADWKIDTADEVWEDVKIHRVSRPGFDQDNRYLRLLNSMIVQLKWIFWIFRLPSQDVYIIGTDPQMCQFVFPFIKLRTLGKGKLVHWCFDVYPEAILAYRIGTLGKLAAQAIQPLMGLFYRSVDLMIDLGPCMRELLDRYPHGAKSKTLTPWALKEPKPEEVFPETHGRTDLFEKHQSTRKSLFGDAKLGILYSGSLGRAHTFEQFLELARTVKSLSPDIHFCFAGSGGRMEELKEALTDEDTNISFAGFAKESEFVHRLLCADMHLLSLEKEWKGIVVPSKFFGSLAAGRPLIYSGPTGSSISVWIQKHQVGFCFQENTVEEVARSLVELSQDRKALLILQRQSFECYHRKFSKSTIIDGWLTALEDLLSVT